ncbi:HNH endonuclease signature motif containing protein [soil metagenome]
MQFGIAKAEVAQQGLWRSSALVFAAIHDVLREAAAHPEVFVDEQMLRGDAVELSVRAAVADLAVRLNLSEATVRSYGHIAGTLQQRVPQLWGWFVEGEVSTQNAREAASVATELPDSAWAEFDAQLVGPARSLAPARFAAKARALREMLHPTPLAERHELAVAQRRVTVEQDRDGMGWISAYLPSEKIAMANARVDAAAFEHFRNADETRTMNQLRADVFADLLLGDGDDRPKVTLALTIPMLALLGHSGELAVLEGAGPIDLDTARRLVGDVPSFTRLLTDPVSGRVLQMDPKQYRLSAAIKRWFILRQVTCDFPGCGRRAANCDLDHTVAWADGGLSTLANLAPRCRKHHTMKHQTKWKVEKLPGHPEPVWTSPTGYQREADPPPF